MSSVPTTTTTAASTEAPAPALAGDLRTRATFTKDKYELDRNTFEQLLRRRFFISQAFDIYGGVAGLYDFGPPGCAVKSNLISLWRNHFVLYDSMLEVDCTCLTPKPVLDASGHTAKFSDYMVRDVKLGNCFRADHILKSHLNVMLEGPLPEEERREISLVLAQVDNLGHAELTEALKKYKVKAPESGNDLTEPAPFNLMFGTPIGPGGELQGFLRPETAQGIFVNFKKLLEFNGGKLPFAAAQVGIAFRNEISPRAGLLRVREFPLAEIEYFVNPSNKTHANFATVKDKTLPLVPASRQIQDLMDPIFPPLGQAVADHVIGNEALAYFMSRTFLFLRKVGIPEEHLRFRQHLKTEMAHYAADCWDAEIRTSYGWVEVVGHADRTCFDLSRHAECSKQQLTAYEAFKDGTKLVPRSVVVANKKNVGMKLKSEAQAVLQHLESLSAIDVTALKAAFTANGSAEVVVKGKTYVLDKDLISFKDIQEKITGETFVPHVIEPSFGIGRIIYCILEHAFWTRPQDKDRGVLSLPPVIAPIKVSLFPLLSTGAFAPVVAAIAEVLTEANIPFKVDETGQSIGRRYARTDELGIPFAITVDHTTLADNTVTLRDRDSCAQVRVPSDKLVETLQKLINHRTTFAELKTIYPTVVVKED